ncbi:ankyrin repeat domain-containing protein 50-like [Mytilus trossulus]|uniref:ankyrin repeat domain-containing protein 50-like n=1 Tax=Mytilus trossulus TaxID=6551 RepID=UPI003006F586
MVLDNLISRCILMIEDREEIVKPTTQRERNKVLLDILTERPYPTFQLFKDVLQESEPSNSFVQQLVKRMMSTENRDEHINWQGHEIVLNKHKVKLQKNYMMFVHGVDSKTDIADHLYQSDVLSTEEKEEIFNSSLTQQESNRLLYNKLIRKGGDAYTHLLEAVRHGKYQDVASEMEKTELSDQEIQLCQIGMKKLKDRHEKKDILMDHDEVIPKHIQEQFEKRLEQWKKDDQQFVSTEAEKHVMQKVLTQSSVTLVGNSGTGKSFLSKHIALIMKKHGYTVIPCSKPKDIGKWFKHGRKTLFVFDDVCGRYTLNQQIYTDWKQRLDHIISLLEDKCCKIISTCRLEVYKDELFSHLSIFKKCNIDLSSQKFKFSAAEKFALAEVYFKEKTDEVNELSEKYDFFPLLCSLYHKQNLQKSVSISSFFSNPFKVFKDQLEQMYRESDVGKMQYCSLVLCVIFNNTLTEENMSPKDKKIGAVIEDLLEECELNKGTSIKRLKNILETLEGTYVVKEGSTYKIIHDKLFDFLAKYFGEKMLQIFIDHANTDFIQERFLWKITDNMGTEIEFVIRIPDNYAKSYIDRLLKDWENRFVSNVCQNRNMSSTIFTEKMVKRLNQLELSKQEELVRTKDIHNKDIALGGSCYMGTIDLVKWLISRNSDVNYCREDGCFPLLWASQEGHVNVVKELLQHSADVNKCTNDDTSPLYIASQEGHVDVVKELLQHSADVNKCTKNDASPLYIASHNGHVNVVKELLQHSADVNKCNNDGISPLSLASQNGHVDVVKELLQHSADVNKCNNNDVSPLCIASQNGHVNVVKELLQHSADVNKCNNDGISPLYIASQNGHVDVVKELLQHSADVNKCNNKGVSPLHFASYKGHVDVVKELLQHSADVNKCDFKGKIPLNVAQEQGHIEIESLLKGKEINQH